MLTHTIIVHKQKIEPPRYNSYTNGHIPSNVYNVPQFVARIDTNEKLKEYLEKSPITKDMFVVSTDWHAEGRLKLWRVHYVIDVIESVEFQIRYERGHPVLFHMVQVETPCATPWFHWEPNVRYRPLTDEEYKQLVEPEHDIIQNRIQEYRKAAGISDRAA